MKFTLTINSDDASELVKIASMLLTNGTDSNLGGSFNATEALSPAPTVDEKPTKQRAQKKPKFEDPGDKDPFGDGSGAHPSPTTGTDPFGDTAAPRQGAVETDDFGDPIMPDTSAPKITLDMLRAEMQAKSTVSPELKEKCKALVKSYNVEALGMIGEDKYPEVLAKIKAL